MCFWVLRLSSLLVRIYEGGGLSEGRRVWPDDTGGGLAMGETFSLLSLANPLGHWHQHGEGGKRVEGKNEGGNEKRADANKQDENEEICPKQVCLASLLISRPLTVYFLWHSSLCWGVCLSGASDDVIKTSDKAWHSSSGDIVNTTRWYSHHRHNGFSHGTPYFHK